MIRNKGLCEQLVPFPCGLGRRPDSSHHLRVGRVAARVIDHAEEGRAGRIPCL